MSKWNGVLRREIDDALLRLSKRLGNPTVVSARHGIDVGLINFAIETIDKLEQKIEILEGI